MHTLSLGGGRTKTYIAALALVASIAGGGSMIAADADKTIPSTATAGQPSCVAPFCWRF